MPKIRDLGVKVIPATMRPPEIGQGGGVTPIDCCDCTNPFSRLGDCNPTCIPTFTCGPCTVGASCVSCSTMPTCGCSNPITFICGCSNPITIGCGCSDFATCGQCSNLTCFCSRQDTIIGFGPQGIDRAQINALKDALRARLEEIEKFEASLGPQTSDAIDAREKEIKAELDELKARRKDLDKKK